MIAIYVSRSLVLKLVRFQPLGAAEAGLSIPLHHTIRFYSKLHACSEWQCQNLFISIKWKYR